MSTLLYIFHAHQISLSSNNNQLSFAKTLSRYLIFCNELIMSYATIEALRPIPAVIYNENFVILILPCLSLHFMSIGVMFSLLSFNKHPF